MRDPIESATTEIVDAFGCGEYAVVRAILRKHFAAKAEALPVVGEEIDLEGGAWKVQICGDQLQIVDAAGRRRHSSMNHMATGLHFAMALAKIPFNSDEQLDRVLRMGADRFPLRACAEGGGE